jgi:hypothetical protein
VFNYHPLIKIFCVGVVCFLAAYINHLMFNGVELDQVLSSSSIFWTCSVFYLLVILFFTDYFWQRKMKLILVVWLLLHTSLIVNALQYMYGHFPPWYSQYSQSGSMVAYSFLLLFVKGKFPNWLRLFSMANLLVIIPCIWFFFEKYWPAYQLLVYVLCFLPMISSLVFIKRELIYNEEVVDN